jgi:hypothetical protein
MTWGSIYRKRCCGSGFSFLMSICRSTPLVQITIGCWIGRAGCHLAGTDGSGICPTGFNVPTEAQLKAEINIWDTTNSAAVGAFNSVLKLPVADIQVRLQRESRVTKYTNESKCLILNATNTPALGALNIVEL